MSNTDIPEGYCLESARKAARERAARLYGVGTGHAELAREQARKARREQERVNRIQEQTERFLGQQRIEQQWLEKQESARKAEQAAIRKALERQNENKKRLAEAEAARKRNERFQEEERLRLLEERRTSLDLMGPMGTTDIAISVGIAVSIGTVISAVCDYFNTSEHMLLSTRSTPFLTRCRRVSVYLCRKYTIEPFREIASAHAKTIDGTIDAHLSIAHKISDGDDGTISDIESIEKLICSHKKITVETIRRVVCEYYNITFKELISRNRSNPLYLKARHIGMYIARYHAGLSTTTIANLFGGFDHTSVLHASKKIAAKKDKYATELGELYRILGIET